MPFSDENLLSYESQEQPSPGSLMQLCTNHRRCSRHYNSCSHHHKFRGRKSIASRVGLLIYCKIQKQRVVCVCFGLKNGHVPAGHAFEELVLVRHHHSSSSSCVPLLAVASRSHVTATPIAGAMLSWHSSVHTPADPLHNNISCLAPK